VNGPDLRIYVYGFKRGQPTIEWTHIVHSHDLHLPWIWHSLVDNLLFDLQQAAFEHDLTGRTWEAVNEDYYYRRFQDLEEPRGVRTGSYLKLVHSAPRQ
jgi:hypothetical protein